jgi:glucokinase
MTQNAVVRYPESRLSKDYINKIDTIDGKVIFEYARNGSEMANAILTEYVGYLVTGLENIVDILQPDEIVLAGGITNEDDILMALINKQFSGRCLVRVSGLKNDAGLMGAALLAKQ